MNKNLETKRLILRKFKIDDAEQMFNNWGSNPNVSKYVTWQTHKSVEDSKAIINIWINEFSGITPSWAIVLKENNEVIGNIALVKCHDHTPIYYSVGYCLSEQYWGKGLMPEALSEIIRYCFEELNADRVEAEYDIENPNSGKVMLKSGMKFEGTLKNRAYNNHNPICSVSIYGLTKEDYFKNKENQNEN